jgi:hypothetical protein
MKNLFAFILVLFIATFATTICNTNTANAQQEFKILYNDSINDIPGTDTTIIYPVRGNSSYIVQAFATGTITGTGGRIYLMESIDGLYFTKICRTVDSLNLGTYCDTIATGTEFRYFTTNFPAKYLGIKLTKGTCKGKIKVLYSMKKNE